jgi:hypothetical protein
MIEPSIRTISLTDGASVKVHEDEWQVAAEASGDSFGGHLDHLQHRRARERGELEQYRLIVRLHADGRAVVYGILKPREGFSFTEPRRGGESLDPGADLISAIRRVGEYCELPDRVVSACIATLAAAEL